MYSPLEYIHYCISCGYLSRLVYTSALVANVRPRRVSPSPVSIASEMLSPSESETRIRPEKYQVGLYSPTCARSPVVCSSLDLVLSFSRSSLALVLVLSPLLSVIPVVAPLISLARFAGAALIFAWSPLSCVPPLPLALFLCFLLPLRFRRFCMSGLCVGLAVLCVLYIPWSVCVISVGLFVLHVCRSACPVCRSVRPLV